MYLDNPRKDAKGVRKALNLKDSLIDGIDEDHMVNIIRMYCSFNDSTIINVASTRCVLYAHHILILIAQNMID